MKNQRYINLLSLLAILIIYQNIAYSQSPNILLIIADDLGVDYTNGYHNSNLMPTTPNIDMLRDNGILFENAFSAPKCTPSRASIMSGKYGIKTNVSGTPGNLDLEHKSIFKAIEEETNGLYSDAVVGKWHISSPVNNNHPSLHGVDFYTGLMISTVSDYYAWERTENGETNIDETYVTTALTNSAIDWLDGLEDSKPWFLWLAHVAPHSPFHTPPESLYSISNPTNSRRQYIAMIEAMDHEIGRLLASLTESERENTLIIYIGDNGTPNTVLQDYPDSHGKATLYQGGIRVPFIVSGAGVERKGEREDALIHITDIYATLLEVVGADLEGGIYNSMSFKHLLGVGTPEKTREYNYSDFREGDENYFTIRNDRYKLIESLGDGKQEFFDLLIDSLETNDLILGDLDMAQEEIKTKLEQEANQIRIGWSCSDNIKNGDEQGIDCGGTYCDPCNSTSVNESNGEIKIRVYPNPSSDMLRVDTPEGKVSVRLLDLMGETQIEINDAKISHELRLGALPKGVYLLELKDDFYGEKIFKKIIVK